MRNGCDGAIASTATASVGEITAPSANAIASGNPGISACETTPTTSVVITTRPVANSTTGIETRQIVNWDVAQANWNRMTENAHHAWIKLRESVSS